MRAFRIITVLVGLMVSSAVALAQEENPAIVEAGAQVEEGEEITAPPKKSIREKTTGWAGYLNREFERIGGMDLYGVTSQLPKGYLSMKWDWGTITASKRYNRFGELGPVMEPISFTAPDGSEIINIDLGLSGGGGGHTFQFSYGISDPVDWYFELPFTYMDISFSPKMSAVKNAAGETYKDELGNTYKIHPDYAPLLGVTNPLQYNECKFMYETLPALGRPTPATEFRASWLLGDINTGFSWNIFRNERMSIALTPRVYFPTGRAPDPNSNLMYGTGPEMETGIGGWAVGATQGYDIRLFKYKFWLDIILSSELTIGYAFKQERAYPTNFVTPSPLASALDDRSFPDLTHLEGTFSYTPGFSLDWTAQLQIQVAILGLGVAYGVQYAQEPSLGADPAFISMVEGLELFGPMYQEGVQLAASISLLPFYIPIDIAIQRRWITGGYNTIVFDDFWQLTVKAYLPLKWLWDRK